MEEIDLVAEVLTGNRRHFWLKPYSTPRIRRRHRKLEEVARTDQSRGPGDAMRLAANPV
jgi:hypothetical protein